MAMAKDSPLPPARDTCHRLRNEWECMMNNAESATNRVLSAYRSHQEFLTAERAQVQSIQEHVADLRRSVFPQLREEERKVASEMAAAEYISKNIWIQFAELKRLQSQLACQLGTLKSFMAGMKNAVLDKNEPESGRWATTTAGLGSVMAHNVPENKLKCSHLMGSSPAIVRDMSTLEDPTTCGLKSLSKAVQHMGGDYENRNDENQDDFKLYDYRQNSGLRMESVPSGRRAWCNTVLNEKQSYESNPAEALLSNLVIVKAEPIEEGLPCSDQKLAHSVFYDFKAESGALQAEIDELDHVPLSKRLEILKKSRLCEEKLTNNENTRASARSHVETPDRNSWKDGCQGNTGFGKSAKKCKLLIETALQEDAPGLLEKLQEKGLLKDIEVYCSFCGHDCIGSCTDSRFKDLELVASKLWGTATGLFKQQHVRQHLTALNKGPSYCLACLVALIEQTRSLKQRSWPVEWGWCRQLQAFLFVFDKHNRIVLERPEYGNATYFFELVQSLPVQWQVGRLIRVLSVTALGKTAILENRPLELGYDLTDDEARILKGYGWTENTGLGSFLNFCDRVVHDIKDDDNTEWWQKIGKCLMDGYDRGRITVQSIPHRLHTVLENAGNMFNDSKDDEDMKLDSQI